MVGMWYARGRRVVDGSRVLAWQAMTGLARIGLLKFGLAWPDQARPGLARLALARPGLASSMAYNL